MRIIKKFSILLDKRQKNRIGILFAITLVGAFLEVLGVSLMLPLVSAIMTPDIIETNKVIKEVCRIFDLHSHRTFVIVCIAALIMVFLVKNLFLMVEYYVQARFVYNNQFATKQRILHAFMCRPYEFFLNAESGEILRVIQNDVGVTYSLLMTLLGMATETIVAAILGITIFFIDMKMTLFVMVMMGLIMLAIAKVVKPILSRKGLERQKHGALEYKWLLQGITGIKEVKVTHREEFFEKNFEKSGRLTVSADKWNSVFVNIPRTLIEMVSVCSVLAFIALDIYFGREIETLIPALSAFAMAAVKLMPSANRIVNAVNSVAFQEPSLDKLIEDLKEIEESPSDENILKLMEEQEGKEKLSLEKEITFNKITYKYPNSEKYVLKEADMVIPVGKSVGVVGRSGAGKTTAVDIMLGLLKPESGSILTDGTDVMSNYADWLAHIGYIPQSIFMLDDSIKANVAFGCSGDEISDEQVYRALEDAQLADFVKELPDGVDTQIGERGIRLSGGQRQRIGIARALYHNPELLIFDEATSALDGETEAAIMESINSLHGKKTMIIIAHRLQTIEGCDMVYRVQDGKIKQER